MFIKRDFNVKELIEVKLCPARLGLGWMTIQIRGWVRLIHIRVSGWFLDF